jgi:hypothetical protein
MSDKNNERCETCNAWMKQGSNGEGLCRALPPVPIFYGLGQRSILSAQQTEPIIISHFPAMRRDGWCRKWEPQSN